MGGVDIQVPLEILERNALPALRGSLVKARALSVKRQVAEIHRDPSPYKTLATNPQFPRLHLLFTNVTNVHWFCCQ